MNTFSQGFHSTNLLSTFIEMIEKNPELLSTANEHLFPKMITCITMVASWPENWSTSIWPAIELNRVYLDRHSSVDWLSITRQLIAIGFYDVHLISETLNQSYLNKVVENRNFAIAHFSFLDIYQDCMLNQICGDKLNEIDTGLIEKAISINLEYQTCPFQGRFEKIFGTDKLISSVRSNLGHYIQHIMRFDRTTGSFSTTEGICRSGDDGLFPLEDISKTENEEL